MKSIKLYMSHAIRGAKGPNATDADMRANNEAAMRAARVMRAWLHPLPVEIYCPAEHDEFVLIAYREGVLNETNILDVDCSIVGGCDGLMWYSGLGPSKGAEVEMAHARKYGIPILEVPVVNEPYLMRLESFVGELCQES